MFRQSNKDVVERLCRQYWNHIPFNLSDYNLLKTFQWFETDLGEIHQQKPNVSDVLDLARKFHDEAQKADHFAGYRKILAILIYRIFQFYAESPIELNEIRGEFPEYTDEVISVALCVVGLCVRLDEYVGRHMALINHLMVNIGMAELESWFKPTQRLFVFHQLLDHLKRRVMEPLMGEGALSEFDLHKMTVIDHVRKAISNVRNVQVSPGQVTMALAWVSEKETDRAKRSESVSTKPPGPISTAILSKTTVELGAKRKADGGSSVLTRQRKRANYDSGYWEGSSGSSGSAAEEAEMLRAEVERF
ncbi:hypothetical protein LTR40_011178, partial [Exophiala xenobiotica]